MGIGWLASLQVFLQTFSGILTAGIAITAFSLLLYALAFNLRDRVARTFAIILICTVIIYTSEAIASIEDSLPALEFWLRLQWVGIVFLPAVYLHFSDALLETTGKPSRGRRRWAVRLSYLLSFVFLMGLPFAWLVGPVDMNSPPAPHLRTTWFTDLFIFAYLAAMVVSWINFVRSYKRTTTSASRRRMYYLIAGALAPALGAFPFLPYSPNFAADHQLTFWTISVLTNTLVGILLVVMAYSVAFFGVSWPERVVKIRLFKWIMRGPFTASLTLTATTLTRRAGESFGTPYTAMVPIVMVGTILLLEYLITLLAPLAERWLFYGNDKSELDLLRSLENKLLTRNDLQQFFEMSLAAARDRLQAPGAYLIALDPQGIELVLSTGKTRFSGLPENNEAEGDLLQEDILQQVEEIHLPGELGPRPNGLASDNGFGGSRERRPERPETRTPIKLFRWGEDFLWPLFNGTPEQPELIGLLGISGISEETLDIERLRAMDILAERAAMAIQDRRIQRKVFLSLESLSSRVDIIQRLRAVGQYDGATLLENTEVPPVDYDLANWVKDALSHYWGGPKLTQNPLLRLRVVQHALTEHEGNNANALRAILREAIDRVRPEGERRFTAEWILYNILEMKFVEGRKVREVAMRLAMSEADLYRKQRIAVEAVAKTIGEMEAQARKESVEL